MTKEEYYKSQICAQVYRATVRENHRLRQVIAGTDPESQRQRKEDGEAFALVKQNRARAAESAEAKKTAPKVVKLIPPEWDDDITEEPMGVPVGFICICAAIGIAAAPLLWVL